MVGATAVCTPSQPLGLATAHKMFGRKRWRDLVQPAIRHAHDGLVVDWQTMLWITSAREDLAQDPGSAARFLRDGAAPQPTVASLASGVVRLPMPDLAKTLSALAEEGADVLYKGALGRALAADLRGMGGCFSDADLTSYRVREWAPLEVAYQNHTISVLPELNGGTTAAVAYAALTKARSKPEAAPGAATFSAYASALRHAWEHRFERLGDAGERSAPTSTTHLSIVDRDGNMVTLTQTLLSVFGARVVSPSTGILMNNGINWFDPTGGPNGLAPGRRALANYTPAIMTGAGETVAIGGSGGRKIIPAVVQLLALMADFGMDLDTAIHQPRIDVSGLGPVAVDRRLDASVAAAIGKSFDTVLAEPVPYPFPFTFASAVRRKDGLNEGATEPEHPWAEAVSEEEV
jgi:gamma-glutamyltranspeptidase / glutathione hydrolase